MSGIATTGECFKSVLAAVADENGLAAGESVRREATEVVAKCVAAYEAAFGAGDVGEGGTGLVGTRFAPTPDEPIGPGTNGLIYGKVQSGKTNLTIATVALASANGFRVFVVLTSDNTWLGKQTYSRFRDQLLVDGPVVVHWEDWRRDPDKFGRDHKSRVDDVGVLLVCTKNVKNLEGLLVVLKRADARRVPALIVDDEADNASLNTKEARSREESSKVFEKIGLVRKAVPNHLFIQVTATPQSLLLQRVDHPLRPAFSAISKPGKGYVGGDLFFSAESRHVHVVDSAELDDLRSGRINPGAAWSMPAGLRLAICCFVLGAAHKMTSDRSTRTSYSMLVHICHKKISHESVADTIREFVRDLDQALRGRLTPRKQEQAERWLLDARVELERTTALPEQAELVEFLKARLRNATPEVINADNPNQEPEYRPGMNILVGGNRLGRGVTIKGLMVTYYGRDAKQKTMDTIHQHARMFGYRQELLDVTRLFSAQHIIDVFRDIHEADEGTRNVLETAGDISEVEPVWVGQRLRPTRANVLNPAAIGTLAPGRAIFPPRPLYRKSDIRGHTQALDKLLAPYSDGEFHDVPADFLIRALSHTPSERVDGFSWEDERVNRALAALQERPIRMTTGKVQVLRARGGAARRLKKAGGTSDYLQGTGYLSGRETQMARDLASSGPVLSLVYEAGSKDDGWDDQPFYAPTLVLPATKFAFMFAYE